MNTKPPASASATQETIEYGDYLLRSDGSLEIAQEVVVDLPRRLSKLFWVLAAAKGEAVSRRELLEKVWSEEATSDENLTRAIADLRKILSVHGRNPISSIYGLGYRLNTEARPDADLLNAKKAVAICEEAWHRLYQRQLEGLDVAERFFVLALEHDRKSPIAWQGVAETQFQRMMLGYTASAEAWPAAKGALEHALKLDPNSTNAMALMALGFMLVEWNFETAIEYLDHAQRIDPEAYIVNQILGWRWLCAGMFERAESHLRRAMEARPLAMEPRGMLALTLLYDDRPDEALREVREAYGYDPSGLVPAFYFAFIEATLGSPQEATLAAEKAATAAPDSPLIMTTLAYTLAREGKADRARAILMNTLPNGMLTGAHPMACPAWLTLNDKHSALEALHSGMQSRSPILVPTLHDPRNAMVKGEPLFAAIRQKVLGA